MTLLLIACLGHLGLGAAWLPIPPPPALNGVAGRTNFLVMSRLSHHRLHHDFSWPWPRETPDRRRPRPIGATFHGHPVGRVPPAGPGLGGTLWSRAIAAVVLLGGLWWRQRQPTTAPPSHGGDPSLTPRTRFHFLSVGDLERAEQWRTAWGAAAVVGLYCALVIAVVAWLWRWPILDAAYFCAASLATVGYGDLHPSTPAQKLFTCAAALVATSLIATALGDIIGRVLHAEAVLERPRPPSARRTLLIATALLSLIIAAGAIPFRALEGAGVLDAVYWATITVTTIGYGDQRPITPRGKAFATLYILIATPMTVRALSWIAQLPIRAREQQRERAVEQQFGAELTTSEYAALMKRLRELHMTRRGELSVSKAQFTVALMHSLGRVTDDDLEKCAAAFEALDPGHDMQLDPGDIADLHPEPPGADLHPTDCPVCLRGFPSRRPRRPIWMQPWTEPGIHPEAAP